MNLLLLVTLIVFACLEYTLANKRILAPNVVIYAMFIVSTFFIFLNGEAWEFEINFNTYLIIVVYLFLASLGIKMGSKIVISREKKKLFGIQSNCNLRFSKRAMWLCTLLSLATVAAYFRHQFQLAASLGNTSGVLGILFSVRSQVLVDAEVFQLGTAMNVGISFTRAFGFVCLYMLIHAIVFKENRKGKYITPIICALLCMILSSGRGGLITIVCAALYDLYICLKKKGIRVNTGRILKYGITGMTAFLIAFWWLGHLTGKSGILNLWDTLSLYIGSSILCFDYFINNDIGKPNFIGTYTFRGIYNLLSRFGLNVVTTSNHAEMVRWSRYSSNVYTSFRPYVMDYGIIFAGLLLLLVGLLIGFLWKRYLTGNGKDMILFTYGRFIGYATAMFSIAERILSETLALNALFEIFFFYIIIRYCVNVQRVDVEERIVSERKI